jgi:hypothetical protein
MKNGSASSRTSETANPDPVARRSPARDLAGLPFHPFLFAAYAVLALLAANVQQVPLRDSLRSFAFALAVAGLALAIAWLATRKAAKAGLLASLVVVAFFSYGHLYDVLRGVAVGGVVLGRHRFLAVGLILLVAGSAAAILLTRRSLQGGNRILNLVGAAALVLALVPIAVFARASIIQGQNPWSARPQTVRLNPPSGSTLPDIYYIILDGYARSDYMTNEFGFDNSEFMTFLRERGFYVAEASRPNHVWTALSLSSSLNMEFVQNLGLPLVRGSYPSLLAEPIRHSRVRHALETIGYSTVALSSGWAPTEIVDANTYLAVDSVDIRAQSGPARASFVITPFESQFLFTTPLRLLASRISDWDSNWARARAGVYPDDVLRDIILAEFQNLGRVATLPGPKFVFAHIVAPHAPYLFTADGEPVPREGPFTLVEPGASSGGVGDVARYRDQAIFVTRRTEDAIDSILRNSLAQPIIILQSDHGSGAGEEWKGLHTPGLGQRTSILNAYLVPEPCRDSLYPSITPVNSFRVVFDCAFGASLPLLPDLTYYSPNPRGGDYRFALVEQTAASP